MTRWTSIAVILLGVALWADSRLEAQGIGGYPGAPPATSSPTISPYLNLLRRGNSAAFNYYGLVKPELEWRGAVQDLSTQQTNIQNKQESMQNAKALPATGHATGFMNHQRYFMNSRK